MIRALAASMLMATAAAQVAQAGGETTAPRHSTLRDIERASSPFIEKEARAIAAAAARGDIVRITGDRCYSSCTMWLKVACVTPEARLGFHRPSLGGIPMGRRDFVTSVRFIASHYPTPALRRWYASQVVTRPGDQWLTGAELAARFGVDLCDG